MNIVTEGHGSSRRKMDLNVLSRAGTGCSSESQVQALMTQPNNSVDEPKNRTPVLDSLRSVIVSPCAVCRHCCTLDPPSVYPGPTFLPTVC